MLYLFIIVLHFENTKVQNMHLIIFRSANIAPLILTKCKICTKLKLGVQVMEELKELRVKNKLTQQQAADLVGISLRSYKSYENDLNKKDSIKYRFIFQTLYNLNPMDETHGILQVEDIKQICSGIFKKYDVTFCYLFGSYAKGNASPESDVDLLIETNTKGLKYYGLVEDLRTGLKKRIDLLDVNQLDQNPELMREILRDGIKIYG